MPGTAPAGTAAAIIGAKVSAGAVVPAGTAGVIATAAIAVIGTAIGTAAGIPRAGVADGTRVGATGVADVIADQLAAVVRVEGATKTF